MTEYLDVLIPRGGKNLIDLVVRESTVPVLETGAGNCHVYVDNFANVDMVKQSLKTQKHSVYLYVTQQKAYLYTRISFIYTAKNSSITYMRSWALKFTGTSMFATH